MTPDALEISFHVIPALPGFQAVVPISKDPLTGHIVHSIHAFAVIRRATDDGEPYMAMVPLTALGPISEIARNWLIKDDRGHFLVPGHAEPCFSYAAALALFIPEFWRDE